jgi:hypothetical protein
MAFPRLVAASQDVLLTKNKEGRPKAFLSGEFGFYLVGCESLLLPMNVN